MSLLHLDVICLSSLASLGGLKPSGCYVKDDSPLVLLYACWSTFTFVIYLKLVVQNNCSRFMQVWAFFGMHFFDLFTATTSDSYCLYHQMFALRSLVILQFVHMAALCVVYCLFVHMSCFNVSCHNFYLVFDVWITCPCLYIYIVVLLLLIIIFFFLGNLSVRWI